MDKAEVIKADSDYQAIAQWPAGCKYSVDQRISAIALYATTGNMQKVARAINIPDSTLEYWKNNAPWWHSQLAQIRDEKNQELDAQLSEIISRAGVVTIDRLKQGDEIITKDGDRMRKLVTGRDAATIGAIAFDKRQILRNQPTSITGKSTDERLTYLADRLRALDNMLKPAINHDNSDNDAQ